MVIRTLAYIMRERKVWNKIIMWLKEGIIEIFRIILHFL